MRRLLTIYGLVCALALGAWGHTLATATCAPVVGSVAVATQDHACCRAHGAQAAKHQHADQQMHAHAPAASVSCCRADVAGIESRTHASVQADTLCEQCVSRSAPAPLPTGVRGLQLTKRADIGPTMSVRALAAPAPLRAAVSTPPQHAPPAGARRHLLLNTFLI